MESIWFLFNGLAINKLQVCTVKASMNSETGKYSTQLSLSNGVVLNQEYESEESCTTHFSEITGVK